MSSEAALVFPRASPALVKAHVRPGALVIAVDAGAEACLAAGIVPAYVVGDMDSVPPAVLAACEAQGARIERHARAKRDTDAALALSHARGCGAVTFIGSAGGRADHALANLHLLAATSLWARARAIDATHDTWVVTPDHPLELALPVGATLSAIPFDARVEGVSYVGLEYDLQDATFEAGDPYGVSNLTRAPPQRIRVTRGRLLVIVPR